MALLLFVVAAVLLVFQLLLVARLILDWSGVLAGPAAPGSTRWRLSTRVYSVTEPVLAPVRRVVPPLRIGPVALDLAFILVFLGAVILRRLVVAL